MFAPNVNSSPPIAAAALRAHDRNKFAAAASVHHRASPQLPPPAPLSLPVHSQREYTPTTRAAASTSGAAHAAAVELGNLPFTGANDTNTKSLSNIVAGDSSSHVITSHATASPIATSAGAVPTQAISSSLSPAANTAVAAAPTAIATGAVVSPAPAPASASASASASAAAAAATAAPDTSKECGAVFVCIPCIAKPITIGWLILIPLVALLFTIVVISGVYANARAQSASTSALSYAGRLIDKDEWSYTDVILPLSYDLVGNASKMLAVFGTQTPNPFLPLLCSSVTKVCDFTAWTGGTSEFDLLGPNNDNLVPLALTSGGVIDRSAYARLELSYTNFVPSLTGGSVGFNWRVVLPPHMVNSNRAPATSLLQVQFEIGAQFITVAQGSGTMAGSLTLALDTGTISQYPLDDYTKTISVFCTVSDPGNKFGQFSSANPKPRTYLSVVSQPLSFILKIDKSDTGVFAHSEVFVAAPVSSATLTSPQASLTVTFTRPIISRVFPGVRRDRIPAITTIFIILAFWIIAIFDVLYLTPFLGTGVKLNGPPTVGVCASLLFALPGIRNAMPGNAPIGSVCDFIAYFWAVVICVLCFAYAVARWCVDVHPPPPTPPAEKKAQ